jgi:hypothetical protein
MGWGLLRQGAEAIGPLFQQPAQKHSPTSIAAANRVASAAALRARVLAYLVTQPDGATDEELQTALDMPGSTERPRRVELVTRGLVRDSGRTRQTRSGRQAVVWVAS